MASDEAVVVATIAFGMGIGEIPGYSQEYVLTILPKTRRIYVRYGIAAISWWFCSDGPKVIHYQLPKTLENFRFAAKFLLVS